MESFHPRIIGVAPCGEKREGDRWYELLVTGRDELGALSKLTALLAEHQVNLAPSGGYYSVGLNTFIWTTFANFALSRSPPEAVVREVTRFKFVTHAEVVEMKEVPFDNFLFPVVVLGRLRAVVMSAEPLLRVEKGLADQFGSAGPALMFEQGRRYGIDNVRQIREIFPNYDRDTLMAVMVAWLRTTGWGIFEFDELGLKSHGRIRVTIKEPPNAGISGFLESHFTNGTTAGIIESVHGRNVRLNSSDYDEARRILTLVFYAS